MSDNNSQVGTNGTSKPPKRDMNLLKKEGKRLQFGEAPPKTVRSTYEAKLSLTPAEILGLAEELFVEDPQKLEALLDRLGKRGLRLGLVWGKDL